MVYLIIPAFNEGEKIKEVINECKDLVDKVVVVDDGSVDNTLEQASLCDAIALKHIVNRGQGAALQTGTDYALNSGGKIIIHYDADGQFSAHDILEFRKVLETDEYDVCLGSRFLGIDSNLPTLKKHIIFPIARIINKLLFNISLSDPQSGFRAFTNNVATELRMEHDGSAHCNEFLYKVFKYKFRVKEIPIKVKYEHFGQGLFSGKGRGMGGLRIIKDLIIARFI